MKTFALLDVFVCELDFMDWLSWNIELSVWKRKKVLNHLKEIKKSYMKSCMKSGTKELHERITRKCCYSLYKKKDRVSILPSHKLLWFLAKIYLDPGFEPLISSVDSAGLIHSATALIFHYNSCVSLSNVIHLFILNS